MKTLAFLLPLLLLLVPVPGAGEIFKWTDENGVVHYSENPPPDVPCEELEMDDSALPPEAEEQDKWAEEWLEQQRREREEAKVLKRAEIESARKQSGEDCAIAKRMLAILELECPVFYDSEGTLHARCPRRPVWVPRGEIRFIDDAERQALLMHYRPMRERCGDSK